MSLERKDVRLKLDADVHAAMSVLCSVDGVEIGSFIERLVVNEVAERVHVATLVADKLSRAGISRIDRAPARRAPDPQAT